LNKEEIKVNKESGKKIVEKDKVEKKNERGE